MTDIWELAALTQLRSQVRRAWAPFLYVVDGAAFLLVILVLYFIFFASMWATYSIPGTEKQTPYSWGANQTITWALLSAIGWVTLSCNYIPSPSARSRRSAGICAVNFAT
jgi:hypothetical protein